ncbi:MAG: ExeM/NucH family extracellular endonuclease [Pseudomonadota bacterium]
MAGGRDIDYVTISVTAGSQLDSIVLDDYIESAPDGGAFFGIGNGSSLPGAPGGQSAGDLVGGLIFDESEIGQDILALSNGALGTGGFGSPLGEGEYTLWFNQTGGVNNRFDVTFNVSTAPIVLPDIFINEVDADQTDTDAAEFIELFGDPGASLDGLSLVLYNGSDDASYDAIDLDGQVLDENGFFVVGSSNVANVDLVEFTTNGLQNGADAVALVVGDAADFPTDTPVASLDTGTLVDAIVYGTSDADDAGLLGPLGEMTQYNDTATESINRLPDGTATFVNQAPTPGVTNVIPMPPPAVELRIHEVQGDTDYSDFVDPMTGLTCCPTVGVDDISPFDGVNVIIEAIVTADFQSSNSLQGFYVQEEDADADANAGTSEGIFIFDGSMPAVDVSVGDLVRVTGTVSEFFGETQISASAISVVSSGNMLPTATVVEFPTVGTMIDQDGDFVADLESVEGMLVTIPTEMTVTELFQLDRFGTLKVSSDGRLEQFTQNNAPDATGFEQHQQDIAARTLTIDDGQDVQNPNPILLPDGNDGTLTSTDSFRMGDTLTNITGVVTYSEDFQSSSEEPEFRIHLPTADYSADNPRPATPEDVTLGLTEPGVLKVASLNVLNYFTTLDDGSATTDTGNSPRGADDLTRFGGTGLAGTDANAEFDRQKSKIVDAIVAMDADILGLVELENSATDAAIADLVTAVNTALGSAVYDYIPTGVIGGDAIAQGLIYKTDSVTPTGGFSTLETFNGIDFTDPLSAGRPLNRPALAQTFTENANGETVTVAVNHLKSKGSLSGLAADNDQGDGQGNNNATRDAAADLLAQWLASDPTGQGSDNILIVGDLNAYAQEDPITTLAAAGYTDVAGDVLGTGAYSFVFDGQIGTLDYLLANAGSLSRVTGITEWHINADEADAIDYNLDFGRDETLYDGSTPARHSDHDPVIMGLDFRALVTATGAGVTNGTAAGEVIEGDAAANFIIGRGGEDRMIGGEGGDRYVVDSFFDIVYEVAGGGYDRVGTSVSLVTFDEVEAVDGTGTDDITIIGNDSDNWIRGNSGNNLVTGGLGNDRVDGRAGNDTVIGDQGNDILEGGAGADVFVATEDNGNDIILDFEDGVDLIDLTTLGLGFDDLVVSGTTNATVSFAGGSITINGVNVVDLSAADFIEPAGAPSVPVVSGTDGDDNISLLSGPVEIRGLGGNDLLRAFSGDVTLVGGEGDDRMYVYDADTVMIENAGEGTDTVYTRVSITLGDNIEIGATNNGDAIDITGNASDNRLTGNDNSNVLSGLAGVDRIVAGGGNDTVDGGTGVDFLEGGAGADVFLFEIGDGRDEILDFALDVDVIDLSGTGFVFGDLSITDVAGGALVDYSNGAGVDTIEVLGVMAADMTEDQFAFALLS